MHYFFSIKLNDDQICESIVTKSYKFIWDENINDPLTVNLNKGSIKKNNLIKKKKRIIIVHRVIPNKMIAL